MIWSEQDKKIPFIDSKKIKIDSLEKLFESFLSGKSKTEQSEFRRQRDRTKRLFERLKKKK